MATTKKTTKKSISKNNSDPCWEGYENVGMKMKNGKLVPNSVPVRKGAKKKTNKS